MHPKRPVNAEDQKGSPMLHRAHTDLTRTDRNPSAAPSSRRTVLSFLLAGTLGAAALSLGCGGTDTPGAHGDTTPPDDKPSVLVVLSSRNQLDLRDDRVFATGYYLNELIVPVRAMIDAGLHPVFANPDGNPAITDPHSISASYFGNDEAALQQALTLRDSLDGLRHPLPLAQAISEGLDRHAGVFFPGGHAPMGDLLVDRDVGRILRHFHDAGRPTGLLCHGPIALLAAMNNPEGFVEGLVSRDGAPRTDPPPAWPYAGYKLTVFSTAEESAVEEGGPAAMLGGKVRFYPEAALREAGGEVIVGEPWKSHVIVDRELYTAQQPASDGEFSAKFVPALVAAAKAQKR
ncbi:type 1 glutamine amidotransferase domain-containing protein [Chondromyces apiculatus]|uniref:ThiJ/PfpI family protein n=1 Tax=Chondromyces apiculatus DSM 436 TaxID=1192034 RepID=A0A017TIH5_9BACT|nr:type 1 glutamine amidotransferase domain-containing protein [Chondromyces apiculatus]EYF08702.1 ThiJ/PfpI family protein [Chondromyces apiculatus DSM 436]